MTTAKPTPKGWPRVSPSIIYQEAGKAIDFLVAAFGFDIRLRIEGEGGRIEHSELTIGDGVVMVSDEKPDRTHFKSPRSVGGMTTGSLMVYVDDADAHCTRARAHGATIGTEPKTTDYGEDYWTDRGYEAIDPEGHRWYFAQRIK